MRILMLDDEPENTVYHAEALEYEGYTVIRRSTVDEALALLQHPDNIDLIIMDLLMPPSHADRHKSGVDLRETGVMLFHKIRNEFALTDIPIIVMSVVRDPQITQKIKDINQNHSGHLEFLRKPLRPKFLIDQVRQMLRE